MDDKLRKILDDAKSRGMSINQMQDIVNRYNQKNTQVQTEQTKEVVTTTPTETKVIEKTDVVIPTITPTPTKNPFEQKMSVNKIGENVTEGISGPPTQAPYFSKTTQRLKEIENKKANIDSLANDELLKKEYIQNGIGTARVQGKDFVFNEQDFETFKKEKSKPKNTFETIFDQATTGVGNLVETTLGGVYGFLGAKKDEPTQVTEQTNIIAPILNQKAKIDNEYNSLQSVVKGNEKALQLQKSTGKNVADFTLDELMPKTERNFTSESTKFADFKKNSADALNTIYGRMGYVFNENEDKFNALSQLNNQIKATEDIESKNSLIAQYNNLLNDDSVKEYFALQDKAKEFNAEIDNRLKTDFKSTTDYIDANKDKPFMFKVIDNTAGKLAAGVLALPYRTLSAVGGNEDYLKKELGWTLDASQGIQDYLDQNANFTNKYNTPNYYNATDYKGYKLLVDDNGNAYSLRDANLNEVKDEKNILSEWNNLENKTKVENKFNPYSTIATTSQVMADMIPLFAGGYVTNGSRAAATLLGGATIVAQTQNDIYDSVKDRTDLNEREKNAYAMAVSTAIAGLNMAVTPKFELNLLGATSNAEKNVLKKVITDNAVKYANGEITAMQVAKEYAKYFVKHASKEMVQEVNEEWLLENLTQNTITDITNKATGSNIEMQKIDAKSLNDILIPTVLSTGLMSGLSSYRSKNELQLEALNDAVNNVDRFNQITDGLVSNGTLDEVKATETKNVVSKIANTLDQANVTNETDRRNLTNLLFQNETIRVRIDGNISDDLKSVYKKQLSNNQQIIDKLLNNEQVPTNILEENKLEVPVVVETKQESATTPIVDQKEISILERKIELGKALGEDVSDLENQLKTKQDAIQIKGSNSQVQRVEQPQMELFSMEQGNQEPQIVTEQSSQAKEEEKVVEPTRQEEVKIEEAAIAPIRQLGTGANVYFESEKYRVNDNRKDGGFMLNVGEDSSEYPIANINFKSANEAVKVAEILQKDFPKGIPSDIDANKYVEATINQINKQTQAEQVSTEVSTIDTKVDTKVEEVKPTAPKELTLEQKKHNRIADLVKSFNELTNRQKAGVDGSSIRQDIIKLSSELGYSIANDGKKISVTNDKGKQVKKIGLREEKPLSSQEDIDYAMSEIGKGRFDWNGSSNEFRVNLGISWSDIRQGVKDLKDGKPNSLPAKRLVEAIAKTKEQGGYEIVAGSGSLMVKEFVSFDQLDLTYELSADEEQQILENQAELEAEANEYFNNLTEEEQIQILQANGQEITDTGSVEQSNSESESETDVSDKESTEEPSQEVGGVGVGGDKKTNTVNGYEFTKTPTLENVIVEPIDKSNNVIIEKQMFADENKNVLAKGVKYIGGGWYEIGGDNFGSVDLYNTVTKEGVSLNHKQGGRTGVFVQDFIKNNSRYNDNIAVRGSKFTQEEHNPKFGGSGHYKGTYFYVGLSAESKALEHGKNLTKVDIENANLYELVKDGQTSQSLKNEAKKAGYDTRDASGYAESEYLKKQGYDGIKRGNEIILFEPKKFEVKEKIADLPNVSGGTVKQSVPEKGATAAFISKYSDIPLQMARREKYLDSAVMSNGKQTTERKLIEERVKQGWKVTKRTITDDAASKKLNQEYERLKRTAPIGNENHPETKRLRELEKMPKSLYNEREIAVKKEELRLESPEGTTIAITPFGEDYVNELLFKEQSIKETTKAETPQAGSQVQDAIAKSKKDIKIKQAEISKKEKELETASGYLAKELKSNQKDMFDRGIENAMFDNQVEMQENYNKKEKELATLREELKALEDEKTRLEDSVNQMEMPLFGKSKIADGLSDLGDILGSKLSAYGEKRPELINALTKIGQGLIEMGLATIDNVIQKIKEQINDPNINIDDYKDAILANMPISKEQAIKKLVEQWKADGLSDVEIKNILSESETGKTFIDKIFPQQPKERSFTRSLDDLEKEVEAIAENKDYVPTTNKAQEEVADNFIQANGVEEATNKLLDNDLGDLSDAEVNVVAMKLIKLNNANKNYKESAKIFDEVAEKLTEAGRLIQTASLWNMMDPQGAVEYALRLQSKGRVANKEVVEAEAKTVQQKITEIAKEINGSKEIKDAIGKIFTKRERISKTKSQKALDWLESIKIKGVAYSAVPGANLLPGTYNAAINIIQAGIKANIALNTAVEQAVKYIRANITADEKFNESEFKKFILNNLPKIQNDSIKIAQEELGAKISEIVDAHYTIRNEYKKSLLESILSKTDLTEEEAKIIEKIVEDKFAQEADKKLAWIEKKQKNQVDKINAKIAKVESDIKAIENGTYKQDKKYPIQKSEKQLELEVLRKQKRELLGTEQPYVKIIDRINKGKVSNNDIKELLYSDIGLSNIDEATISKIEELHQRVKDAPEGSSEQRDRLIDLMDFIDKQVNGTSNWDIARSLLYAGLLSGTGTQVKNFISNSIQLLSEMYVNSIILASKGDFKGISQIAKGMITGLERGMLEAGKVMSTGYDPNKKVLLLDNNPKISKKDILESYSGKIKPISWAKYVRRLMVAADTLSYYGAKEMESYALARKIARDSGLRGQALQNKMNEILLNGQHDLKAQAIREGYLDEKAQKRRIFELIEANRDRNLTDKADISALKATYNNDPSGLLGHVSGMIQSANNFLTKKNKALGLAMTSIVPFTRVISNVVNEQLNWTPIGLARALTDKGSLTSVFDKNSEQMPINGEERTKLVIKASTGLMLATGLLALALKGDDDEDKIFDITANGYGNSYKNSSLYPLGWKPYTIGIKGTDGNWVRYNYQNTPFGQLFGMIGTIADNQKYNKEADITDKLGLFSAATINQMFNASALQGASTLFDAVASKDSDNANKIMEFFIAKAKTPIPNILKEAYNIFDNQLYDKTDIKGMVVNNVPVFQMLGKPKLNVFGEPIEKSRYGALLLLPKTDDTFKRLYEVDVIPRMPLKNKKIYGEEMNNEQFYDYVKIRGQELRKLTEQNLDYIVNSSEPKKVYSNYQNQADNYAEQKIYNKYFKK